MDEQIPSNEWMRKVALAASAPDPTDDFFNDLRLQLEKQAGMRETAKQKNRRSAWSISLAAFLVLGACVLIVGPENVAAALREALGYIPGFGVVHTTGLRLLAGPVIVTREGITLTLKSVIADSAQTSVSYDITGLNLPQVDPGNPPDPDTCFAQPLLRLPNGEELLSTGGGGMSAENYFDGGNEFPPLPDNVEDVALVFTCLPGTLPGTAPENWLIPFHLVRNPAAPTVFPVQPIDTPSAESMTPNQASQANAFLQQISIAIDSIVEVEDGFILIGTIRTSSDRYTIDPFFPPGAIEIRDSTGAVIPLEAASVGNDDLAVAEDASLPAQWAYKVQGKYFRGPLTLSLKWVTVSPRDPITFSIDVGAHPQRGQTWTLNRPLNLLGAAAIVQSAEYVVREDMGPDGMQGLEFSVQLPDEIEGLQLNYLDPNPHGGAFTSLSDGFKHGKDTVQIGFLSTVPLSGSVGVDANVIFVDGPWTVGWNPPAVPGAPSPTPIPQACLTNDSWEAVQLGPVPPIPPDMTGRLFYSREGSSGNGPEVLLSGLDGSDDRLLQAGAMDAGVSWDGTRLAVVDGGGALSVVDIETGETTILARDAGTAHPIWSPDGRWIAFMVMDFQGGLSKLYIIRPDGSGRREAGAKSDGRDLAGWFPDSASLLILAAEKGEPAGYALKVLDLTTDDASPVLPDLRVDGAVLSADGEWIAYQKLEFGRSAPWISVARLDGSDRRLLFRLDGRWQSMNPVWSPDGKWLLISVLDTEEWSMPFGVYYLLNPTTCEFIPLPGSDRVIKSWIP